MIQKTHTVIELFCGAGGTSYGFQEVGFDVKLGLDIDKHAIKTFINNHNGAIGLHTAIEDITGKDIFKKAKLRNVDVLLGGPSCQGFSTHGKRIFNDPRNYLYKEYLRLVSELKPKWLLFENVKGMLISGKGEFFNHLSRELMSLGYNIKAQLMNTADYGIPQRRERLIIIGNRVGKPISFPLASHSDPRCSICSKPDKSNRIRSTISKDNCSHCSQTGIDPQIPKRLKPWVSVKDAISDLVDIDESGGIDGFVKYQNKPTSNFQKKIRQLSKGYDLHKGKPLSDYANKIISKVPPGEGIRSIPEKYLPERFKSMRKVKNGNYRKDCTTLYHRLDWNLPSYTITCFSSNVSSGAFAHPVHNRAITVREAARLQSFPDKFIFHPTGVRRQIGNAVPPMLSIVLAKHLLKLMNDNQVKGTKESIYTSSMEILLAN